MEEIINSNEEKQEAIILTPTVKQDFTTSVKWGKFFAILGIIVSILMLIIALIMLISGKSLNNSMEEDLEYISQFSSITAVTSAIIYIITGTIYLILSLILLKSVNNFKLALNNSKQENFALGFQKLKLYLTINGILTIVGIAILAIFIVLGIVVAATLV